MELTEIHMHDAQFTWSNKRKGTTRIWEKLDRGFGNRPFVLSQQCSSITVIPMLSSDHNALLLSVVQGVSTTEQAKKRPVQLET